MRLARQKNQVVLSAADTEMLICDRDRNACSVSRGCSIKNTYIGSGTNEFVLYNLGFSEHGGADADEECP
jgi:hypothetical protein